MSRCLEREDIACFPLSPSSFLVLTSFSLFPSFLPLFFRLPFSREMFNKNSSRASTGRKCRRWCARRVLSRNRSGIPFENEEWRGGGRVTRRRRDAFLNSPHSGHRGRRTIPVVPFEGGLERVEWNTEKYVCPCKYRLSNDNYAASK